MKLITIVLLDDILFYNMYYMHFLYKYVTYVTIKRLVSMMKTGYIFLFSTVTVMNTYIKATRIQTR